MIIYLILTPTLAEPTILPFLWETNICCFKQWRIVTPKIGFTLANTIHLNYPDRDLNELSSRGVEVWKTEERQSDGYESSCGAMERNESS